MKRYIFALFLSVPFFLLLAWTVGLHYQKINMPEVILPITGYDPRDLLAGHYIRYQIDWDNADCDQFENGFCPIEAFEDNRMGFHRFYIPENRARALDTAFITGMHNGEKLSFSVVYAYKDGVRPIPKRLLINGKDWQETITNNKGE